MVRIVTGSPWAPLPRSLPHSEPSLVARRELSHLALVRELGILRRVDSNGFGAFPQLLLVLCQISEDGPISDLVELHGVNDRVVDFQ